MFIKIDFNFLLENTVYGGDERKVIYRILWCNGHIIAFKNHIRITFPVWLRNQLLSAGLEPVLSQTEKA